MNWQRPNMCFFLIKIQTSYWKNIMDKSPTQPTQPTPPTQIKFEYVFWKWQTNCEWFCFLFFSLKVRQSTSNEQMRSRLECNIFTLTTEWSERVYRIETTASPSFGCLAPNSSLCYCYYYYQFDWRERVQICLLSILTRDDNETIVVRPRYLIIQFHGEFVDNYNRMKITHKHRKFRWRRRKT